MELKLADRLNSIEESVTLALNARVKQMAAEGEKIYNFTAGEPSTPTPGYIKDFVATKLDQNHYTPVAGINELREKLAEHCQDFYAVNWVQPNNIMVTAGGKPGLYFSLLALVSPGDEVILPTPAWVSYKYLIELVGGVVVEAKLTDDFDLDCTEIKSKLSDKTKVIIINSPNNPTGSVYSAAALSELAEIINQTNVTVLADDMYTKLVFDDKFQPITKFGFKNLIISSGFSKSQALTGWRIGYLVGSEQLIKATTKLQSHALGNTTTLSQYGALAALAQNDKPPMLDELKANLEVCKQIIPTIDKIRFIPPSGAFYVLLDVRQITKNSLNWCEQLLVQKKVALVPGEAFSAPGYARLSFTTDAQTLTEGLNKIKEFIEESKI